MEAWWTRKSVPADKQSQSTAVAYYRHSAEIGQENSVEIQQDNIRDFATRHDINIIKEFADRGKSGLNAEGRPAFNEMMEWVRLRNDFNLILVLDISRWGRFQDTDLSAHYEAVCTQHGKQVVYTNLGFSNDNDRLIHQLRKSIDRYQSAEYSRNLSKKVFEGAAKVAHQGYRPGGPPPYGFYRMMLDENKEPDRILNPGQRKALQNGRIVLVPGDMTQIKTVQKIFMLFTKQGLDEGQIADYLNAKKNLSPGRLQWSKSSVRNILTNQEYIGSVVYNRTSQRLKTRRRKNPIDQWVITPNSHEPIVSAELFEKAQQRFENRKHRYSNEVMLEKLQTLYEKYKVITARLIKFGKNCPSPSTYASKFGGISGAFQAIHNEILQKVRNDILNALNKYAKIVDEYEDFIVINRSFTLLIQPSVPIPNGYGVFWTFRPDHRQVVDITLGVALSDCKKCNILGYLVMPRLMVSEHWVRLSVSTSSRIEMYGYSGLNFIKELIT